MRRVLRCAMGVALMFAGARAVAAERPAIDASIGAAPPAAAARMSRIARDPDLSRIAKIAHRDERYGVPSFLWAAQLPATARPAAAARPDFRAAARAEVGRLAPFYGLEKGDAAGLTLRHLHDTGRGAVVASFRQAIDGIEVFRDELRVSLDRAGRLISASGYVPPGSLAGDVRARQFRLSAAEAAQRAVQDLSDASRPAPQVRRDGRPGREGYESFALTPGAQAGLAVSEPIRAKKVYFHLPAALVPAYYVEVLADEEPTAYVIAAEDGAILFRQLLLENDTFSYRVWAETTGEKIPLDGPQGNSFLPHPTGLPDFSVPSFVAPSLVSLQNGPISTNDPWLPPGATETLGNNAEAYADLTAPDGFNAGDLRATTTAPNTFDRTYDINQNANASADQRQAAITQLFYVNNFLHDWFYDHGFNEAAGNAQASNYGRGGFEGDALKVEAQDYSGTNNSNMSVPADGARPRMQMFVYNHGNASVLKVQPPAPMAGSYQTTASTTFGPQTFNLTAPLALFSSATFAVQGSTGLPVGSGPEWVAIADLNHDGRRDLATANYLSDNISVLLSNGAGGFGAATHFAAGDGPYTVAPADLNLDGHPDLVVANFNAGSVSVLPGNGAGVFGSRTDYASGAGTGVAGVGRINGDAIDDVVTVSYFDNTVRVFLGNGTGGLTPLAPLAVGANPNWVALGDMDNDGDLDLVTANYGSSTITVRFGDGSGAFLTRLDFACGSGPLTLALGDLDGDGDRDVVTADYNANTLTVMRNQGGGAAFASDAYATATGPVTVALGDLNGDGLLDAAVSCDVANQVSWWLGNGGGSFQPRVDQPVGTTPYAVAIGDVNGDGEADLVSANFSSSNLTVLAGNATALNNLCGPATVNLTGRVALIDRGTCSFIAKAQAAAAAGAVGVVIADNVVATSPPIMGGTGPVSIPVVAVTLAVGNALKAGMLGGPIMATLERAPTVLRDGTIDNSIVAHEWGHYMSHRLVGAGGLTTLMNRGMNEGWADFVAMLMSVRPGDEPSGTYANSPYSMHPSIGATNCYYFGSRRVPYSTDLTKNALTFKHVQDGMPLPVGPPTAPNIFPNSEPHNTGEVWCTMLWECYAALIADSGRLTFAQAQSRMKDYLVTAYQLTPNQTTLLEARDALLSAAYANDPQDLVLFWQAFAKRGAGVGAVAPPRFSETNIGVVESYSLAGATVQLASAVVSDDVASCDDDGYLDAGESGRLTLGVRNVGASTLGNLVVEVASDDPLVQFPSGTSFNLPATDAFATSAVSIPITVGASANYTTVELDVTVTDPDLLGGSQAFTVNAIVNADLVPTGAIESVYAPSWPYAADSMGTNVTWRRELVGGSDWRFVADSPTLAAAFALVSPALQIGTGGAFRVIVDHAWSFEKASGIAYDGGVVEISTDGGATWADAGGFASPGYTDVLYTGSQNPLSGRAAFSGSSPGYPALTTTTFDFGTTYQGQTVHLRFRVATDAASSAPGWGISQLQFEQVVNQPFLQLVPQPGTCTQVAVADGLPVRVEFALAGRHPVKGTAKFRFALPVAQRVTITLHDLAGRRVATLMDGEAAAGWRTVRWEGSAGAPAGVYFARLATSVGVITRRFVMVH